MYGRFSFEEPTPLDLPAFLPRACARLCVDFDLRVVVELQEEYVSQPADEKPKRGKSAKSTVGPRTASGALESSQERDDAAPPAASSAVSPFRGDGRDECVTLAAVHDAAGALVELALRRAPRLPRALLALLALCAPLHPALARLTVRRTALAGDALHEMAKLLVVSQITEVCLDDSPVAERNYYELLEGRTRLRSLSLARCELDDRDCALLAARLRPPRPAASRLLVLCLASNRVADAGAAALAEALRGNRALRYLDLAGNRISDEGAARLFDSLVEFPLTYDELIERRRRLLDRLRLRDEIARKCRLEFASAERALDEQSRGGKRRKTIVARRRGSLTRSATGADRLAAKAQAMADELVGAHSDPSDADETVSRDGYAFSAGNATLCALNLAYNSLSYASVARLAAVLRYQAARPAGAGLVRARLDGNALPASCAELRAADALLRRALESRVGPVKSKPEKDIGKAKSK